jgi:hypothetical protein
MTGKADFSEEEWELLVEGPPTAGMVVATASRGGTFRESFSIAKGYTEARQQRGASELLDDIASAKPKVDRGGHHSPEEVRQHALQHLRDAVKLLEEKASPEEVEDYRRFVLALVERVAGAHEEGGQQVSDAERATIEEIASALGAAA